MLHCDPPEAKRVTYIQITSTNSRWFSPGLKHPLSVSGSNGFGDNIPPEVHLLFNICQPRSGWQGCLCKGWVRAGQSAAAYFLFVSCCWLAVCSSPAPSHCLPPFLHSFVFPRSFERPRCVHYGKRWRHLIGGEGRQQQGIGKVVIFHPPPPHSVGEPIFPDFVAE